MSPFLHFKLLGLPWCVRGSNREEIGTRRISLERIVWRRPPKILTWSNTKLTSWSSSISRGFRCTLKSWRGTRSRIWTCLRKRRNYRKSYRKIRLGPKLAKISKLCAKETRLPIYTKKFRIKRTEKSCFRQNWKHILKLSSW